MWIVILVAALICFLAVWEFWICEGAHLGRRAVVFLYDLTAKRYEHIKRFDPAWEQQYLGEPLVRTLAGLHGARVLDVGAGSSRLARAVLPSTAFHGVITHLDASRKLLKVGRELVDSSRTHWVQSWAIPLPFSEGTFDAVSCLEMLEFTPQPRVVLLELIRVLRPGGWLLITNRIGWRSRLILGRTFRPQAFHRLLQDAGLVSVDVYPWQVEYDLAWGRKPYQEETRF
jgi:2-polyprenyl-3-methyl-5-hydroxy-6-metoxy-1,4-benzoquinol methylase